MDANLDLAPIRTMEPAITERLRLAFPSKLFAIERVPPTLSMSEFKRIVRQSPFIGLAWVGVQPDPQSGRQLTAAWRWRVILVVKATGALEARFKGDTRDIGLDGMSDIAMALLQGVTFEGIGLCTVTGAQAIYADGWADDDTVLAQVDFEIRTTTSPAPLKLLTPDDFKMLGVEWLNADAEVPDDQPDTGEDIIIQGDGP